MQFLNVSILADHFQKLLNDEGGIAPLIKLLESSDPHLKVSVVGALWNAACFGPYPTFSMLFLTLKTNRILFFCLHWSNSNIDYV
jgi:hypothetical protein